MIYTKFGEPVEILELNKKDLTVKIKRKSNGETSTCYLAELRADKGLEEIYKNTKKIEKNK